MVTLIPYPGLRYISPVTSSICAKLHSVVSICFALEISFFYLAYWILIVVFFITKMTNFKNCFWVSCALLVRVYEM